MGFLNTNCLSKNVGHNLIHPIFQGLVNVPIKHHPTIGVISSPTDICFGDVKQIPKKGHLPLGGSSHLVSGLQPWL